MERPPTHDKGEGGGDEKKMETRHVGRKKDGNNTSTQRLPHRIGGDEKKMETHQKIRDECKMETPPTQNRGSGGDEKKMETRFNPRHSCANSDTKMRLISRARSPLTSCIHRYMQPAKTRNKHKPQSKP